jgi:hypothetical protein
MTSRFSFASLAAALSLALAACGGAATVSVAPSASSAAPKPAASAAASAAASKPAASAAASAKPAASAAAKPTPTFVPRVAADTTEAQITTYPIPDTNITGAMQADIMDVDQAGHLMVAGVTSAGGVVEWDISGPTPKFLRTIKTNPGTPSGVIIAKNVNRIVAALGNSTVVSIDMGTNQVVGTINTGGQKRADELDYDPKDNKIYVANSDDPIITSIKMPDFTVAKKFVDNSWKAIEQPRYDAADGMMYVNIRDPERLAIFDPSKDVLVKHVDLPQGARPGGIWMNPKTNQGVIAIRPHPVVWDFNKEQVVNSLDQAATPDMLYYDAKTDLYFLGASGAEWGPTISIVGGEPIHFITNVPSVLGAHQATFDDTNNIVYFMGGTGAGSAPNNAGLHGFPLPAKVLAAASAAPGGSASAAAKPAASGKPSA